MSWCNPFKYEDFLNFLISLSVALQIENLWIFEKNWTVCGVTHLRHWKGVYFSYFVRFYISVTEKKQITARLCNFW